MEPKKPIVPLQTKFSTLECQKAFQTLSDSEQLYSYYFSRASWSGAKICYFQRSYQSPALLYIILKAFQEETPRSFFDRVKGTISEENLNKALIYLASVLDNCGNYKSFGDSKFIPDLSSEEFLGILSSTKYWSQHQDDLKQIYSDIEDALYKYSSPYGLINFWDQQGTSGYYSKNVTLADAERVKAALQQLNILSQNNRLIKTGDNQFAVKIASVVKETKVLTSKQGIELTLQYGEFSSFLSALNQNLKKAAEHSANDHQKQMIERYIEHFNGGDVNKHKESQVEWVKDKGPSVETNIGFIESYLDPLKVRAEFEGFVAVVNKEESKILNDLVQNAQKIIADLPWGKEFEVEEFKKPDFTSLQVLTFACSSIPVGINIPNYYQIRENHGFKNVNLGNAYGTPTAESMQYIPASEIENQLKYYNPSLFLIVALHELLGHGTGRLYHQLPTFVNPLGDPFETFYKEGDTWHSVFGDIASGYQECRADAVALYLATFGNVRELLLPKYTEEERLEIMNASWLEILEGAISGLEYYDKDTDRWTQAHIAASYAIFSVLVQAGGIVQLKEVQKDGKKSIQIHLNKDAILTSGKKAMGDFLKHLQIYKSTANFAKGEVFFKNYLKVDQKLLGYRDIVIQNKKPRKISVQADVELVDGKVVYKRFGGNVFDAIQSHLFHYRFGFEDVLEEWKLNSPFKY